MCVGFRTPPSCLKELVWSAEQAAKQQHSEVLLSSVCESLLGHECKGCSLLLCYVKKILGVCCVKIVGKNFSHIDEHPWLSTFLTEVKIYIQMPLHSSVNCGHRAEWKLKLKKICKGRETCKVASLVLLFVSYYHNLPFPCASWLVTQYGLHISHWHLSSQEPAQCCTLLVTAQKGKNKRQHMDVESLKHEARYIFLDLPLEKTYVMYCQQSVSDKNIISTYSNTIFIDKNKSCFEYSYYLLYV